MKSLRYIVLFGIVLLLFSCKKFKGSQEIPSYIRIEPWSFTTNYEVEGAATSAITDAWLYINDNFHGCFEIRHHDDGDYAMIPVLQEGEKSLKFFPGIKLNSISSTRVQYPFYQSYNITKTLVPGESVTVSPSTKYYSVDSSSMVFKMEDFENAGIQLYSRDTIYADLFQISHSEDTNAWRDPITLKEKSGHIHLEDTINRFWQVSPKYYDLKANKRVFLELDYKCDADFLVGLFVRDPQEGEIERQLVYLRATKVWKKAYINFTPTVNENQNASYFRYYLRGAMIEGDDHADFYFDNLKLVYTH